MTKRLAILCILVLMVGSFLAGAWLSYRSTKQGTVKGGRKILHYIDPMHPSYTSDKPGIAPDCGMQLEPIYADGGQGGAGAPSGTTLPPGTVQVTPERQQLIGVKTALAEKSGGGQTLRLQGRVVADELRTYVINATIDGWITGVGNNTTGSIVRKHEVLGTFYSSEFLSAGQALLYALTSLDRSQGQSAANQAQRDQIQQFNLSLKQYRDSLRNLGMGDRQIDEMIRTRKYMENVDIVAPGNGLVTVRNISPGQRFERGKELYRIADLSRVWILVDTYGAEVDFLKPGMRMKASLPSRNRTFIARVANIPPQFDPTSRTLKVRLEADNPDYLLRPDMFVDVELPMQLPAMLSVPAEAMLDSGLKKTVFVEKCAGIFEPREVETGRSFGNRVEVVSGLKEGERIAISGTFLLDSESRMTTAAAGISSTPQQDPVCGMYVDEGKARAAGRTAESDGITRYFCSVDCKQKFLKKSTGKQVKAPGSHHTITSAPSAMSGMEGAGHAEHKAMPAMLDAEHKHD
jgi:membrane fusion protein, copper/silver efflux system